MILIPRIKQKSDEYALSDFVSEINARCAWYGLTSQAEIGKKLGVCQATVGNYLRKPETIRLDAFRAMVKQLRLDPVIVLKMLGYSQRDINNISKKERAE